MVDTLIRALRHVARDSEVGSESSKCLSSLCRCHACKSPNHACDVFPDDRFLAGSVCTCGLLLPLRVVRVSTCVGAVVFEQEEVGMHV